MGKKVAFAVIFVLFVVVGVFAGLYFFSSDDDTDETAPSTVVSSTESDDSLSEDDEFMDEDMSDENYIDGDTFEEDLSQTDSKDDFTPSDDLLADNTEDVAYSKFIITKVIDHTTEEEVQPRVVFGYGFNADDSYIKFDLSGNFEMNCSGYFNNVKKGKYKEHDDIIYVEYEDGSAAEYDIKYNDAGVIIYIKVNYGDYDIFFA